MARRIVDYIFKVSSDDVGPRFKALTRHQQNFTRQSKADALNYARTWRESLSSVGRHGRKKFRQMGRDSGSAFRQQAVGALATVGAGFVIKKSLKDLADLGDAMTGIAIKTHQPVENLKAVRKEIELFSLKKGIIDNPKQIADGVNMLVGADFKLADSLTVVKKASEAAAAAQTNTGIVTKGLIDVLTGFDLSSSEKSVSLILSKMLVSADSGLVEMENISQVIGEVVGPAKKAKASLSETLGLMSVLSTQGLSNPSEVGTAVARMFDRIVNKGFAKDARRFGIQVFDENGNLKNMIGLLSEIDKKASGFESDKAKLNLISRLFGTEIRASRAFLNLMGNMDRLKAVINKIDASSGRLAHNFAESQKRLSATTANFRNVLGFVSRDLATLFEPGIDMLSGALKESFDPKQDGKTLADNIRAMIQVAAETAEKEQWGLKFWRLVLIDPIFDGVSSLSKKGGVAGGFLQSLIFDELIARERQKTAKKQSNEVFISGKQILLSKKQKGEAPITEQIRGRIIANAAQAAFKAQSQELRREGKLRFIFQPKVSVNNKILAATGKTLTDVIVSDPADIERRLPVGALR